MAHITAVESMASQLQDLEAPVPEEAVMMKIITTLPDDYRFLETAWDSTPDENKNLENLRARLVQEEKKIKRRNAAVKTEPHQQQQPLAGQALFGSQQHDNRGGSQPKVDQGGQKIPPKEIPYCTHCKKHWHSNENCRKLQALAKRKSTENRNNQQQPSKHARLSEASTSRDPYSFISSSCFRAIRTGSWVADSGASEHMTDSRSSFATFTPILPGATTVTGVGGVKLQVLGQGTVRINIRIEGEEHQGVLHNVLYVPDLGGNLLSLCTVAELGFEVSIVGTCLKLKRDGETLMIGTRNKSDHNLYFMDISTIHQPISDEESPTQHSPVAAAVKANKSAGVRTLDQWHRDLAHVNHRILLRMESENAVTGFKIKSKTGPPADCKPCDQGKFSRLPFTLGRRRGTFAGERIHGDIVGPFRVATPNGARYYLMLKDDYSTFKQAFFLKTKDEAGACIKGFIARVERETGNKVVAFRGDNDGVFFNNDLNQWCFERGIRQESTVPHTPQLNGTVERDHRTVCEASRAELYAKNLQQYWWAEAVNYSVYTQNRVLSSTIEKTPFELYYKRKPDVSHMHEFGVKVRVLIPENERHKLDAKCHDGIFFGYCETQDGYRIWDSEDKKIRISRDVKFLNKETERDTSTTNQDTASSTTVADAPEFDDEAPVNSDQPSTTVPATGNKKTVKPITPIRRSLRGRVPKKDWAGMAEAALSSADEEEDVRVLEAFMSQPQIDETFGFLYQEPRTFKEAMDSPQSGQWWDSMVEQITSLWDNSTWVLVELPPGRQALPCKFDYKAKRGRDGRVYRLKSRLVIKGFKQIPGLDYNESFAPVIRLDSLRMLLSLAAAVDLEIHQFDVKTAFLNAPLEEEIYMCQPEGFVDKNKPHHICRLLKSIYGLIQASRVWCEYLHDLLISCDMTQSEDDPCVYYRVTEDEFTAIGVWVDDGFMICRHLQHGLRILNALATDITLSAKPADHFVGLNIDRDRQNKRIYLSSPTYIDKILAKFGMQDCFPLSIPADPHAQLSIEMAPREPKDVEYMATVPFRSLLGSLVYAAHSIRPDISYAVSAVAKFCQNPGIPHWKALKRVLKYLKGTRNYGLCFAAPFNESTPSNILKCYTDADYAGDLDKRRSRSGYLFMLNGVAISWRSKLQTCVALSTTESEYVVWCESTKEAV